MKKITVLVGIDKNELANGNVIITIKARRSILTKKLFEFSFKNNSYKNITMNEFELLVKYVVSSIKNIEPSFYYDPQIAKLFTNEQTKEQSEGPMLRWSDYKKIGA